MQVPLKANQELVQKTNQIGVLRLIRSIGPISRAELAKRMDLSPSAVTNLTASLLDRSLIREMGPGQSRGGRRPRLLQFNHTGGFLVGLSIEVGRVIAAVTDLDGNVVELNYEVSGSSPEEIGAKGSHLIRDLLLELEKDRRPVYGVGVAVPGIVHDDTVVLAANLGWHGVHLRGFLDLGKRDSIWFENNARAKALGEFWFGAGEGLNNLVLINVGHGVTVGAILNGQLYRGARGMAGEVGHATVDLNGTRCSCGNIGCLQTKVCEAGIIAQAIEARSRHSTSSLSAVPAEQLTVKEIFDLAQMGDSLAREVFQTVNTYLGIAVGHAVNIYDPEEVILTGLVIDASSELFERVKRVGERQMSSMATKQVTISRASLGQEIGVIGAAALAFHNLIAHPIHFESLGGKTGLDRTGSEMYISG